VLAFDASMRNTGWALVRFTRTTHRPMALLSGTIRTGREDGSNDSILGSLERGDIIYEAVCTVFEAIEPYSLDDLIVVHELPAMQGKVKAVRKSEGGTISAMAMRAAGLAHGYKSEAIHGTTMKRLVAGNGLATKPEVGEAVKERYALTGTSNEHVRDALGLAMAWMINEKRWGEYE
jgi:Holliday junction resolvasome RuvABC endonuclease subunit